MNFRTLFLAWQDQVTTREWYPVGRLDADINEPFFKFRYIYGAKRAMEQARFAPLIEFPSFDQVYTSKELFPLFKNRILNRSRPEFEDYLKGFDLCDEADPIEILSINGGNRVTDSYEVFPKIRKEADGSFTCRFFLHGTRHINEPARSRLDKLEEDEPLYVTLELTNPVSKVAVQIQTLDYHMIGWSPRYLVYDLTKAMKEHPEYKARVLKTYTSDSFSWMRRILVEMSGSWTKHKPMSGKEFQALVH